MALDLEMVGANGAPEARLGIRADVHARLVAVAERIDARLVRRMHDFYADTSYAAEELASLVADLDAIHRAVVGDAELASLVAALGALVRRAQAAGAGITAIAD